MRNLAVGGLIVAIVASVFALDARDPGHAAAWCAVYSNGGGNCGFASFEQCLATVRGAGGSCNRNSGDSGAEKPAARKERKAEPKPKRKQTETAAPAEMPLPPPAAAPSAVIPQPAQSPAAAQPAPPAAAFQAATALVLSGQYQAGIAAMKSLGFDNHPDVASLIGYANSKLGQFGEARLWYNRALAADPNHLVTWSYSGVLHIVQGEPAMARADLERIKAICGGAACPEYRALDRLIAGKRR